MALYLGPWQVGEMAGVPIHSPPPGAMHCLDLRSIPQMAASPGTRGSDGAALFWGDATFTPGRDYIEIPESLDATDRLRLRRRLRLGSLSADSPRRLIEELFTALADNTGEGEERNRPMVPGVGSSTVRFGPYRISISRNVTVDSPLRTQLRAIYREKRQRWIDEGQNELDKHYLKWLGYQEHKYALRDNDYRAIQGSEPDELPLLPTTTITESFNTADSTTLGPDLSWTEDSGGDPWEVFSNTARTKSNTTLGTMRVARADSDLSGDDVYSQADIVSRPIATSQLGLSARNSSSVIGTYYTGFVDPTAAYIFKVVSHSFTSLSSASYTSSNGETMYFEVNGSSLDFHCGGASRTSVTDSSITGNTRCGIYAIRWSSGTLVSLDPFEAADLAAGLSIPIAAYHYNHHLGSMT